ncbi:MAG: serine/threonine protein kinase [Lachnospiraceae bacterium]|nr:serine/threonine protein kinase [Lachnospiraceae bacterium]
MENIPEIIPENTGRYRLIKKLGEGGMGCVYLAEHEELKRYFAVKLAFGESEGIARKCLRREAERMKCFDDRRIPYLADMYDCEGYTALVMEYVKGLSLKEYLEERVPLSEAEAVGLMKRMCGIIELLHESRPVILYRDIKPSNFMVTEEGELRLLDFGTALRDETGDERELSGTPGYAAPEQLKGGRVRADGDVYSLGCVFSYMLTGADPSRPPYHPAAASECPEGTSAGSRRLISRCLSEDPDKRPQNASELMDELRLLKPGREPLSERLSEFLYGALLWADIIMALILICMRYNGHAAVKAEYLSVLPLGLAFLWMFLRDLKSSGSFIIRRSWNVIYSEKSGLGLPVENKISDAPLPETQDMLSSLS